MLGINNNKVFVFLSFCFAKYINRIQNLRHGRFLLVWRNVVLVRICVFCGECSVLNASFRAIWILTSPFLYYGDDVFIRLMLLIDQLSVLMRRSSFWWKVGNMLVLSSSFFPVIGFGHLSSYSLWSVRCSALVPKFQIQVSNSLSSRFLYIRGVVFPRNYWISLGQHFI